MSAIGTKRTSRVALHMSAFGGKADIGAFGLLGWRRSAHCNTDNSPERYANTLRTVEGNGPKQ